MIVIREQAEEILANALQLPDSKTFAKRAIHIAIRSTPPQPTLPSNVLIDGIASVLAESDVRLFICSDGDLILLGKDISPKTFVDIKDLVTIWLDAQSIEGECLYFEKGMNWYQFTSMCNEKLSAAEKIRQEELDRKNERHKEMARIQALSQPISQEMAASIAMRRRNRDKLQVLVVEDDTFSRTLVRNSLKRDYGVVVAEDAYNAINHYVQQAPNIMFLDIDLPDANGHDILQRILEIDPKAFIVMLSGNGDRDNVLKAINLGAKGFIGKPFTKDKLLQYIHMCQRNYVMA